MSNFNICCWVPKNLNLDDLLEKVPPTFSYKKDGFVYLIDLWFKQHEWRKNDSRYADDDFVPLHSQTLKAVIYDYQKYLDYLTISKVFMVNNSYQTGVKSKSYKLIDVFYTDLIEERITNPKIIEKIKRSNNYLSCEANHKYGYIVKWFDNLTIDEAQALNYIEAYIDSLSKNKSHASTRRKLQLRRISYILSVKRIKNKDYWFVVDSKSGRLYTPLTNLKKELRQFLKYDNKRIVGIDLSNSQPYLSTLLLDKEFYNQRTNERVNSCDLTEWVINKTYLVLREVYNYVIEKNIEIEENNKKEYTNNIEERYLPMCGKIDKPYNSTAEWNNFMNLVSKGEFYEYIGKYISSGPRNNLVANPKKLVITVLFSSPTDNRKYFKINAKVFEDLFPSLYHVYKLIKSEDYSSLAILLQNIEAEVFLNRICPKIKSENTEIPIFTIHDSICTTEEYVDNVRYIMDHNLIKSVGIPPRLKIEQW